VLNFQGRFDAAEPLLRQSIEMMSGAGIPLEALFSYAQLGLSLTQQGFYQEGLTEAERGLALAEQANHVGGLETCYSILVQIYRLGDDLTKMLEAARSVVEIARAAQDAMFECSGSFWIAWAHSLRGEHEAAIREVTLARHAFEMLKGQVPNPELYAAIQADVALNAGQVYEAQTLANEAVRMARAGDNIYAEGLALRILGHALARSAPSSFEQVETHLAASLRLFEQGNARLEAKRTQVELQELGSERDRAA
jgi:tetratricopeptide (TPR) repeat protein